MKFDNKKQNKVGTQYKKKYFQFQYTYLPTPRARLCRESSPRTTTLPITADDDGIYPWEAKER